MDQKIKVDCCIAGGGPAGMMAGLLFARAGCKTLVLEKHADFLRDFRGDTVHPSTLENIHELGLLDAFLERPHQRVSKLSGIFEGDRIEVADFSTIHATCKFIALMPQWHFLNFLAEVASTLPTFDVQMQAQVNGLIEENGTIKGVEVASQEGPLCVQAKLVIGADGRGSTVRECASLKVNNLGAPIDVLWFKVPRVDGLDEEPLLNVGNGRVVITLDRGDYYQCAFIIHKGGAQEIKERGLAAFKDDVVGAAPRLAKNIDALNDFDEVKLLTVTIDRLERWSRPGLVMIGDSAHAMSPIGGVGINLAVQDAVACANLLAGPLAQGTLEATDLQKVQARRMWPTRATQFMQIEAQNGILKPIISERNVVTRQPLPLRIVSKVPFLKRRLAALVGLGVRPEHVSSPERYKMSVPALR